MFCVAERALRNMLNGMCLTNQSIIISGESGAGKVSSCAVKVVRLFCRIIILKFHFSDKYFVEQIPNAAFGHLPNSLRYESF